MKRVIVKITVVSAVLLLLLTAVSVIGLGLGSSGTSFTVIFDAVRGKTESGSALAIVWRLRLPRVLLGILAGAVLSSGGFGFPGHSEKIRWPNLTYWVFPAARLWEQ